MADVKAACEKHWDRWKGDCSGFVRAVAGELGVPLTGTANAMVDAMARQGGVWQSLGHDGMQATRYANQGFFVVAGLKSTAHGHVAVIVPSASAGYPFGYWGRLGGVGRKNTAINWAWNHQDLPRVEYFARQVGGH
ncbi:MAG: hypothetical protein QJR11_07160 [Fulvimonas sp.]|nr:hypothetical protein [Fulvimonas sp.]